MANSFRKRGREKIFQTLKFNTFQKFRLNMNSVIEKFQVLINEY